MNYLRSRIEIVLRLVWRGRWNAISRAELRWSFGPGAVVGLALLAVFLYGGAIWLGTGSSLSAAIEGARIVVALGWFANIILRTNSVSRLFVLDEKMGVTQGWLLTSLPRGELLWARLAGRSVAGPLAILLMLPIYFLAALGLPGEVFGCFVCGHLARFATFGAPAVVDAASVAFAVPLAVLAASADIAVGMAAVAASLPGALQRVYLRRIFSDFLRSLSGNLRLLLQGLGHMVWFLLIEGACVALTLAAFPLGRSLATAGGLQYYDWTASAGDGVSPAGRWPLIAVVGLFLAAAVFAGVLLARWLLARASVRLAARNFDDALTNDRAEGGG